MKAHRTSTLGLSHHGTGCLLLSASCSLYALEPFFRSLSSGKRAFAGQAISRCNLQECAESLPFHCRAEGAFFTTHWLIFGNVLVCVGRHHRTPSCPPLSHPHHSLVLLAVIRYWRRCSRLPFLSYLASFRPVQHLFFLCMYLQLPSLLSHLY